jgi:hypothetical protein
LAGLGFRSLTLVRPGLIGGERDETRPAEQAASMLLRLLHPVLPRGWRINPAGTIAQALVTAAVTGRPGAHVITSAELA